MVGNEGMTDKDTLPSVYSRLFKPTCIYFDGQDEKDEQAPSQAFSLSVSISSRSSMLKIKSHRTPALLFLLCSFIRGE